jgi:hypothetical protein
MTDHDWRIKRNELQSISEELGLVLISGVVMWLQL